MKTFKVVDLHDNFTCSCGNTAFSSGFFPCDKEGTSIEPDPEWEGYFKCLECEQIYLPS